MKTFLTFLAIIVIALSSCSRPKKEPSIERLSTENLTKVRATKKNSNVAIFIYVDTNLYKPGDKIIINTKNKKVMNKFHASLIDEEVVTIHY